MGITNFIDLGPLTTFPGDYLVAEIVTDTTNNKNNEPPATSISPPTGWTLIQDGASGAEHLYVFGMPAPATSGVSHTYTFNLNGGSAATSSLLLAYSNVTAVQASNYATGVSTTPLGVTLTATTAPTVYLWAVGFLASSMTTPTGMTLRRSMAGSNSVYSFDKSNATTGSVSSGTGTMSASANYTSIALLLAGAPGSGDVSLSWTATPDTYATGYEITRSVGSTTSVNGRTTLAWTDTTTTATTGYTYTIKSVAGTWRSTAQTVNVPGC